MNKILPHLLRLCGVHHHEALPRRLLLALGVGRARVHHRAVAAGRPAKETEKER